MSDSDSFIDEVSEEVRRDRLYRYVRRYGWIAVLAVVLLVGAAGWYEWQKAQDRQQAEAFGDAILAALNEPERAARAEALASIDAPSDGGRAVLALLTAAEEGSENPEAAAERLLAMADSQGVPMVYRQLATLKAVAIQDSGLSVEDRRARLEALAGTGGLVRLLAEEQLALLDIEQGNRDAALERLQRIVEDAEATAGLRQRAGQVIVALGEEPAA
ncbi:tetratricopeptide repeat protein [Roseovarius sp.]|uniref:tetratricopeptide repeat protein n=1 Tax=Roseovarius sp. TaxID=1486281 RepID=UPI003BA97370